MHILDVLFFTNNGRYGQKKYADLAHSDHHRAVPKIGYCRSLCSINRMCAAIAYDHNSHICYITANSTLLSSLESKMQAFVKENFMNKVVEIQYQTSLRQSK